MRLCFVNPLDSSTNSVIISYELHSAANGTNTFLFQQAMMMQKFSTPATGASPSTSTRSAGKNRAEEKAGQAFFNGSGEGSNSGGNGADSNTSTSGSGYADRKPRDRSLSAVRGGYQVRVSLSLNHVQEALERGALLARLLFKSIEVQKLSCSRKDAGKS